MALSNGGAMLSDDNRTVLINSEPWIEAWEAVRKWIHEDDIMAIHYGGQGWEYWYDTMDDVLQDKTGGYTGSSGDRRTWISRRWGPWSSLDSEGIRLHLLPEYYSW